MSAKPAPSAPGEPREPWLERLALHRPELRAWALYDWANSAFWAVVIASVFPLYFKSVAAEGSEHAIERYTNVTTASLLVTALLAPVLGAIADHVGAKKRFLGAFIACGVLATGAMFWIGPGDWVLAAALFALANIGAAGSLVFADALLPSVARGRELDRVATSGFALGYLSGGLLIALAAWMTASPETFGFPADDATLPARVMFAITAAWWGLFSLPILLRVREPRADRAGEPRRRRRGDPSAASRACAGTLRELGRYRQAAWLLVAMLVYLDGVATVIRMATIYGDEIGIGHADLIGAVLLLQFVAVPCSALFGMLAGRIGAKGAILVSLAIYLVICVLAWRMTTTTEYYLLAALVGTAQGGCQALSRSLFASMVPPEKAGEFFGLFGVLEKFAGVLGPAAFGGTIALTGSARSGMLALVAFFLVGGLLLWRVDVEEGRRVAREAGLSSGGQVLDDET